MRPSVRASAPVNAPFSCPNSSLSTSPSTIARTVQRDERPGPPRAARVQPPRHQLLARARLAAHEHRSSVGRAVPCATSAHGQRRPEDLDGTRGRAGRRRAPQFGPHGGQGPDRAQREARLPRDRRHHLEVGLREPARVVRLEHDEARDALGRRERRRQRRAERARDEARVGAAVGRSSPSAPARPRRP
jgi:hypothetical protein